MSEQDTKTVAGASLCREEGDFATKGYSILRNLVGGPARSFLYEYAMKSARNGRLGDGDAGVPGTPCYYGDAFMESLMEILLPRVEAESGRRLFPTYSYFRVYKRGDILHRHQDRPSCEVSVTLNLGYEAGAPWPIWIEVEGMAKSVPLEPGDAMLYRGCDVPHWREQFAGEHSAQVFLHYIDENGPCKDWKYDKRPALSTSPLARRIIETLVESVSIPL